MVYIKSGIVIGSKRQGDGDFGVTVQHKHEVITYKIPKDYYNILKFNGMPKLKKDRNFLRPNVNVTVKKFWIKHGKWFAKVIQFINDDYGEDMQFYNKVVSDFQRTP